MSPNMRQNLDSSAFEAYCEIVQLAILYVADSRMAMYDKLHADDLLGRLDRHSVNAPGMHDIAEAQAAQFRSLSRSTETFGKLVEAVDALRAKHPDADTTEVEEAREE